MIYIAQKLITCCTEAIGLIMALTWGTINNSPWKRMSVIKQLSEVQLTSLLIQ